MNTRRKLIVALGACTLTAPLPSFAQQQDKVWRVGFLALRHVDFVDTDYYYGPFRQGMRELGYVEGKNLLIEWRSAEGKSERLPGLATDLTNLKVDAIVTAGDQAVGAAHKATRTIPIVSGSSGDPVRSGFVTSLAHPGGNITGLSTLAVDISPKHLQMLHSMVPKLSRVVVLINPDNSSHATYLKNIQAAARLTGVTIMPINARTPQDIEDAFSTMSRENAGALIVAGDAVFNRQRQQIAGLAAKNKLPSLARIREYVVAGGLMSYGANLADQYRRTATYIDKIFKGAKPGDLPVEQPTTLELFINGKTAQALGLKIPQSLLVSADKVIE